MTRDEVCRLLGASPETSERLAAHVAVLRQWQPRLKLVGPGTVDDIWSRHVLDCGQIARYVPPTCRRLVDLGSGAGLPGLILAIMGVVGVELVERDERKVAFLHAAANACDVDVVIHGMRIEDLPSGQADVVTARALASLDVLLPITAPFLGEGSVAIFPKGRSVDDELKSAARHWHMWFSRHPSLSDARSSVLVINRIHHDS